MRVSIGWIRGDGGRRGNVGGGRQQASSAMLVPIDEEDYDHVHDLLSEASPRSPMPVNPEPAAAPARLELASPPASAAGSGPRVSTPLEAEGTLSDELEMAAYLDALARICTWPSPAAGRFDELCVFRSSTPVTVHDAIDLVRSIRRETLPRRYHAMPSAAAEYTSEWLVGPEAKAGAVGKLLGPLSVCVGFDLPLGPDAAAGARRICVVCVQSAGSAEDDDSLRMQFAALMLYGAPFARASGLARGAQTWTARRWAISGVACLASQEQMDPFQRYELGLSVERALSGANGAARDEEKAEEDGTGKEEDKHSKAEQLRYLATLAVDVFTGAADWDERHPEVSYEPLAASLVQALMARYSSTFVLSKSPFFSDAEDLADPLDVDRDKPAAGIAPPLDLGATSMPAEVGKVEDVAPASPSDRAAEAPRKKKLLASAARSVAMESMSNENTYEIAPILFHAGARVGQRLFPNTKEGKKLTLEHVAKLWLEYSRGRSGVKSGLGTALKSLLMLTIRNCPAKFVCLLLCMAILQCTIVAMSLMVDLVASGGDLQMIGAVLAVACFANALARYCNDYLHPKILSTVLFNTHSSLIQHLARLPAPFYSSHSEGAIVNMFAYDISMLESTLDQFFSVSDCLICTVAALALIFYIEPRIAAALAVFEIVLMALQRPMDVLSERASNGRQTAMQEISTQINELVLGQATVREYTYKAPVASFYETARGFRNQTFRYYRFFHAAWHFNVGGNFVLMSAILVLGTMLSQSSDVLTPGRLLALFTCAWSMGDISGSLSSNLPPLLAALGPLNRIEQFKRAPAPPPIDVPASGDPRTTKPEAISLQGVFFHYKPFPGLAGYVLKGVDVLIPAGSRVCVVGPSGSGKSSLLAVLSRTHPVRKGAVLYGGRPLSSISTAEWRQTVRVVGQTPFLFRGTIAANVRLGRPDATDAEVEAACRAVGMAEIVEMMPQRYQTMVDNKSLSGGQRQRIALARAMLCRAPVILLDEVASALDAASEEVVNAGIRRLAQGRTCIEVTHRLNTCKTADLIVVLKEGRVVEAGRHEALLAIDGGVYRKLCDLSRMAEEVSGATQPVTASQLAAFPFFASAPLEALEILARAFRRVQHGGGEPVLGEGVASGTFSLVLQGRVEKLKRIGLGALNANLFKIGEAAVGDTLNSESVLSEGAVFAPKFSARAVGPSVVLASAASADVRAWALEHCEELITGLKKERAKGRWQFGKSASTAAGGSSSSLFGVAAAAAGRKKSLLV